MMCHKRSGSLNLYSVTAGWAEHVDEESGATFYYHSSTGETTWEPPPIVW